RKGEAWRIVRTGSGKGAGDVPRPTVWVGRGAIREQGTAAPGQGTDRTGWGSGPLSVAAHSLARSGQRNALGVVLPTVLLGELLGAERLLAALGLHHVDQVPLDAGRAPVVAFGADRQGSLVPECDERAQRPAGVRVHQPYRAIAAPDGQGLAVRQ